MRTPARASQLVFASLIVLAASAAFAQDPAPQPDPGAAAGDTPPGDTTTTTTTTDTPAATTPDEPYTVRLRKLEQKVEELKEQAWRVKARVGMLKEAVIAGGIGSRSTIIHENKMGGNFKLIKLVYSLDANQLYAKTDDTGKLNDQKRIEILSGPIAAGTHTLSVLMMYRGEGYGVFRYLRGYKFTVRSSHPFTVGEGKHVQITVKGYERGGMTTPLDKRPAIEFKDTTVFEGSPDSAVKASK